MATGNSYVRFTMLECTYSPQKWPPQTFLLVKNVPPDHYSPVNNVPPRTRLKTVICRDSDDVILSNLKWPHNPYRPVRLWSHAFSTEWNDLCRVPPRLLPLIFLPHHWVLRQGKKPEWHNFENYEHRRLVCLVSQWGLTSLRGLCCCRSMRVLAKLWKLAWVCRCA